MAIKDVIGRGIGPSTSLVFFVTGGFAIGEGVFAVLTGSVSDGVQESDLAFQWEDAVLILTGATWVSGTAFAAVRQEILDNFVSAGTEAKGWNAEVKPNLIDVVRTSDTRISIAFNGFSGFSISANETITVTVPNAAISQSDDITATPTFTVTADILSGSEIVNTDAIEGPTNYQICDRSGWRVPVGDLKRDWTGMYVRPASYEEQHPQDFLKSRGGDKQRGPVSPEADDNFLVDAVSQDDL